MDRKLVCDCPMSIAHGGRFGMDAIVADSSIRCMSIVQGILMEAARCYIMT